MVWMPQLWDSKVRLPVQSRPWARNPNTVQTPLWVTSTTGPACSEARISYTV